MKLGDGVALGTAVLVGAFVLDGARVAIAVVGSGDAEGWFVARVAPVVVAAVEALGRGMPAVDVDDGARSSTTGCVAAGTRVGPVCATCAMVALAAGTAVWLVEGASEQPASPRGKISSIARVGHLFMVPRVPPGHMVPGTRVPIKGLSGECWECVPGGSSGTVRAN